MTIRGVFVGLNEDGIEWTDITGDVVSIVAVDPARPGRWLEVGMHSIEFSVIGEKPSDAPALSQKSEIAGREPGLGGVKRAPNNIESPK